MRSFGERLKLNPPSPYAVNPAFRALDLRSVLRLTLGVDVQAPKVVICHQQPGGVMSAMFAADLAYGVESSRMLGAVGQLLKELVDAPEGEIADRMGELLSAQEIISEHMEGLRLALDVAHAEMRAR